MRRWRKMQLEMYVSPSPANNKPEKWPNVVFRLKYSLFILCDVAHCTSLCRKCLVCARGTITQSLLHCLSHSVGVKVDKSCCLRRLRHFQFPSGKRRWLGKDVGTLKEQRSEAPEIMLWLHRDKTTDCLTYWLFEWLATLETHEGETGRC